MVSATSARWSRNELTDTRRIRASSALHLLQHTENDRDHNAVRAARYDGDIAITILPAILKHILRCSQYSAEIQQTLKLKDITHNIHIHHKQDDLKRIKGNPFQL